MEVTKNLQPFWTVPQWSGAEPSIFLTEADAIAAVKQWKAELSDLYDRWEKGEPVGAGLIDSTLESDLEGGCYHSYRVRDTAYPGSITEYPAGSQERSDWELSPDFDKVRWGNPALARPARPAKTPKRVLLR